MITGTRWVRPALLRPQISSEGGGQWSALTQLPQLAKGSIHRCAVYTRKSPDEGLEQDFNSLRAQREACEAFIRSQAGEGWRLIIVEHRRSVLLPPLLA